MGVWIETVVGRHGLTLVGSHPSWVCGLKPILWYDDIKKYIVTPFVGVWIETDVFVCDGYRLCRHTLRGCVD